MFKTSVPVNVDIRGAKTVSLITETNGADSNDHAVWADAKLINTVTKVELEDAIAEYETIVESKDDYTANSFGAYTESYNSAKEILLSENATQKQVDDATEALTSAKNSLVYIKDLKLMVERY